MPKQHAQNCSRCAGPPPYQELAAACLIIGGSYLVEELLARLSILESWCSVQ